MNCNKIILFTISISFVLSCSCASVTPYRIELCKRMLASTDIKENIRGIDGLILSGDDGKKIIIENFPDGKEAACFLIETWEYPRKKIIERTRLLELWLMQQEGMESYFKKGNQVVNRISTNSLSFKSTLDRFEYSCCKGWHKLAEIFYTLSLPKQGDELEDFYIYIQGEPFCGTLVIHPINYVIINEDLKMFNFLFKYFSFTKKQEIRFLYDAVRYNNIDIAEKLLTKGTDPNIPSVDIDDPVYIGKPEYKKLILDEATSKEMAKLIKSYGGKKYEALYKTKEKQ